MLEAAPPAEQTHTVAEGNALWATVVPLGVMSRGASASRPFSQPIRYDGDEAQAMRAAKGVSAMSVDVEGLRSTIRNIKQQIAGLEEDIVRLEQIADKAEVLAPAANGSAIDILDLPPGIVISQPDVVSRYVRAHPGLARLVHEMATVLVDEFREERAEIELALYQDPEIDDRYLVLYVRLPEYDDSLMPRLHAISERVDRRFSASEEWVLVTTDYRPLA